MTVVFNGIVEKRSKGCNCKGRKTEASFVNARSYFLPSGRKQTFFAGRPVEVSDSEGEFLLSYRHKDANGDLRAVFSEVKTDGD